MRIKEELKGWNWNYFDTYVSPLSHPTELGVKSRKRVRENCPPVPSQTRVDSDSHARK